MPRLPQHCPRSVLHGLRARSTRAVLAALLGLSGAGFPAAAAAATVPATAAPPASRSADASAAPIVLGAVSQPDSLLGIWVRRVYVEAFRRLGLKLEVQQAPLARLEALIQAGKLDGELARSPAYADQHPDLVRVEHPLLTLRFSVYASQARPEIRGLDDLLSSRWMVGLQRGVVGCERSVGEQIPKSHLVATNSTAQTISLLGSGRLQAMCEVSSEMLNEPTAQTALADGQVVKLFDVGAPMPMYTYLQPQHAALAKGLTKVLRQMRDEGLMDRYWPQAGRRPPD